MGHNFKKKNHREGLSRQNCIFGGYYPFNKSVIPSSQKTLALRVPMPLECGGGTTTIRLPKKMCRDAVKSHPCTLRYHGNDIEVVQSKAIQKATAHVVPTVWLIKTCDKVSKYVELKHLVYSIKN